MTLSGSCPGTVWVQLGAHSSGHGFVLVGGFAGALCYACGTLFHVWQRIHYHQVMRHAFAIGGSACHLIAVLIFVLPRAG